MSKASLMVVAVLSGVLSGVLIVPGAVGTASATCASSLPPARTIAPRSGPPVAAPPRERGRLFVSRNYTLRSFRFEEQQVRELSFTAGNGYMLKQFLVRDHFYDRGGLLLSDQVRSLAIAATSGDFNTVEGPKHAYTMNGVLYGTGRQAGSVLYMGGATGTEAWIGDRHITINAWPQHQAAIPVAHLNVMGFQGCGVTVGFTAKGITPWVHPLRGLPSTLLNRVSPTTSAVTDYVVARQSSTAILPQGNALVLAGEAASTLEVGTDVTVRINYHEPSEITQVIGGMPQIVTDGVNTGQRCNPKGCGVSCPGCGQYCNRHTCDPPLMAPNPRDVIGITQGCSDGDAATPCQYIVVTVDGRQPGWSPRGLQFPALGRLMIQLGAWNAINLDGGGNTELMTRYRNPLCIQMKRTGCVVNHPSQDGRERPMSISVQLVPAS